MIVLVDTDVLIDLALDRNPHAEGAALLLDALERRPGTAFVAWHSLSNFYYMVSQTHGKRRTKDFLLDLTRFIATMIATRNLRHYTRSPIRAAEPRAVLAELLSA